MATRFRFNRDFDHSPSYGVTIAYRAGTEVLIPEAHAAAAEAAGAGERLPEPKGKTKGDGEGAERR